MHPKDAAQRSLWYGTDVRVWIDRGEVILRLEVTHDVPPGVVASEKGAWLSTSRTGQTISALVSADLRADPHPPMVLGAGGCEPSILVCIIIADVCKGCGRPTFRSGVRDDRK
jgi:anaerobic selenocysteine-containing dehydrogenase